MCGYGQNPHIRSAYQATQEIKDSMYCFESWELERRWDSSVAPGEKTQKAMNDIEELAQTLSELPEKDAKQIVEDLEDK